MYKTCEEQNRQNYTNHIYHNPIILKQLTMQEYLIVCFTHGTNRKYLFKCTDLCNDMDKKVSLVYSNTSSQVKS